MVKAMATRTRLTADDLWRMGARRELIDGEVIARPPAGGIHGYVTGRIGGWLGRYVDSHRLGKAVAGVGFVLAIPSDPERVRAPDIENPVEVQQKVRDYPGLAIPLADLFE
jgi:Uma2 family endonuclease